LEDFSRAARQRPIELLRQKDNLARVFNIRLDHLLAVIAHWRRFGLSQLPLGLVHFALLLNRMVAVCVSNVHFLLTTLQMITHLFMGMPSPRKPKGLLQQANLRQRLVGSLI
jgi:hypothetical protein